MDKRVEEVRKKLKETKGNGAEGKVISELQDQLERVLEKQQEY